MKKPKAPPRTKIEEVMRARGMNQRQLSAAMGPNALSRDTISDIVSGRQKKFQMTTLEAFATALQVSPSELV